MENNYEQPTDEWLRTIDVHELLPQREPFVMIGSLTHFDRVSTVTSTTVRDDNIFVDGGVFSPSGLMENVAQTCAARIGYINKYILKKGIQIGYIGAMRDFDILVRPVVGDTIVTTVNVEEEVFGMILATATITRHDEVIATTNMKIAVKDDDK